MSDPRFAIESKRKTKRGLQYEKAIFSRQDYGIGAIQPDATGKMVFTLGKVTLTRGQVLRVYFYEKGGSRNLTNYDDFLFSFSHWLGVQPKKCLKAAVKYEGVANPTL